MNKNILSLENKVALVTGASRGIGEATARLFAEHGAHVIVSSRKIDDCKTVADDINSKGGSAEAFACHIGDMEQISSIFRHIDDTHGHLDILVNNAATSPYYGHVNDTGLSAFEKTIEVNVRGFFYMSANASKRMQNHGGGTIVNVASVGGVKPSMAQGIYSITKAAVINMTQSFAKECAQFNVRVNAVLPGLTDTKLASALSTNEEVRDELFANIPLKRMAQPVEIASAVLFLASDASSYCTATCLTVDGGFLGAGGP